MANWIRLTITSNDEAASHWEAYWHRVRMVVRVLAPSSSVPVAACEKVRDASRKLRIVWPCSVIIDTERLWEREVINSTAFIRKNLPALPSCSMPKHAWQGSHDIRWQKHAWQALKLSFSACHGWRLLYKACQYWSTKEMAFLAQGTICMVFVSGFSYGLWCLTCFFLFLLQLSYSITPRQ